MSDFNYELAHQVMDQITTHPEEHDQGVWRCETGMCFAGWAATIEGLQFASDVEYGLFYSDVVVTTDHPLWDGTRDRENRPVIAVSDAAMHLLGLTHSERYALFSGANTLEDLQRYVKVLEAHADNPDEREAAIAELRREIVEERMKVLDIAMEREDDNE